MSCFAKKYDKVCPGKCCKKGDVWIADMGHGEAIAFKKDSQYYLRDFGESSGTRKSGCSVAKILSSSPCHPECPFGADCVFKTVRQRTDMKWNAILSHPHQDHFKGFHELYQINKTKGSDGKIFETAYLPKMLHPSEEEIAILSRKIEACLLMICSASSRGRQDSPADAFNFLVYEIVMSALSKRVIHLSATVRESESEHKFPGDIFYPIKSVINDEIVLGKSKLESILTDLHRSNSFPDLMGKISSTAADVTKIILKYCSSDHDSSGSEDFDYKQILHLVTGLKKEIKKQFGFRKVSEDFIFTQILDETRNSIDDSSLVFTVDLTQDMVNYTDCAFCAQVPPCRRCEDDKECNIPTCPVGLALCKGKSDGIIRRWLFLGDNSDSAVKALYANPLLHVPCHFIKAGHHGSRGGKALNEMGVKSNCVVACYGDGGKCSDPQESYLKIANCIVLTSLRSNHSVNGKDSIFSAATDGRIKVLKSEAW